MCAAFAYLCRHSLLIQFSSLWRACEVLSLTSWHINFNFKKFLVMFYQNHTHSSFARLKKSYFHKTNNDDLTHSVFIWSYSWFLDKRHKYKQKSKTRIFFIWLPDPYSDLVSYNQHVFYCFLNLDTVLRFILFKMRL